MFGVILWVDQSTEAAVIWCEDHGELALYKSSDVEIDQPQKLAAGDLVRFELKQQRKLRFARKPRLVAPNALPDLVGVLSRAENMVGASALSSLMLSEIA